MPAGIKTLPLGRNPCFTGLCRVSIFGDRVRHHCGSRNPCFTGLCRVSEHRSDTIYKTLGRNPCFTGLCRVSEGYILRGADGIGVAILVLLDYVGFQHGQCPDGKSHSPSQSLFYWIM